jgi:hypothetical protein
VSRYFTVEADYDNGEQITRCCCCVPCFYAIDELQGVVDMSDIMGDGLKTAGWWLGVLPTGQ